MAQPRGYAVLTSPEGVKEWDTLTCGHCQRVVDIKPLTPLSEVGGHCRACDHFICFNCEKKRQAGTECVTVERFCDIVEAQERSRRQYGQIGALGR